MELVRAGEHGSVVAILDFTIAHVPVAVFVLWVCNHKRTQWQYSKINRCSLSGVCVNVLEPGTPKDG